MKTHLRTPQLISAIFCQKIPWIFQVNCTLQLKAKNNKSRHRHIVICSSNDYQECTKERFNSTQLFKSLNPIPATILSLIPFNPLVNLS